MCFNGVLHMSYGFISSGIAEILAQFSKGAVGNSR